MEFQRHRLEIFIMAASHSGKVTIEHVVPGGPDAEYIQEARFLSREEMEGIILYPEVLKDSFWEDLKRGFPTTIYLGVTW